MTTTDLDDLRTRRKELRARFFPNKAPLRLVLAEPAAPPPTPRIDDPVPKSFHVTPHEEPMDYEEFARKMRQGEFPRSEANYRRLIHKIAQEHGYTYEDIVGRARPKKLAHARFHVCWYLTQKMKCSENGVGRMISKDHATVRHGLAKWQARIDEDFIARREAKNDG